MAVQDAGLELGERGGGAEKSSWRKPAVASSVIIAAIASAASEFLRRIRGRRPFGQWRKGFMRGNVLDERDYVKGGV